MSILELSSDRISELAEPILDYLATEEVWPAIPPLFPVSSVCLPDPNGADAGRLEATLRSADASWRKGATHIIMCDHRSDAQAIEQLRDTFAHVVLTAPGEEGLIQTYVTASLIIDKIASRMRPNAQATMFTVDPEHSVFNNEQPSGARYMEAFWDARSHIVAVRQDSEDQPKLYMLRNNQLLEHITNSALVMLDGYGRTLLRQAAKQ